MIYHNKLTGDLATDGFYAHLESQKVICLTINGRANGSDNHSEDFRNLQINARDGNRMEDDWNLLLTRTPGRVEDFQKHSVRLSFGNEKVAKNIYECLTKLQQPIAAVNTKSWLTVARLAPNILSGSTTSRITRCDWPNFHFRALFG